MYKKTNNDINDKQKADYWYKFGQEYGEIRVKWRKMFLFIENRYGKSHLITKRVSTICNNIYIYMEFSR